MDIPIIILGAVMIFIGILIVITQIKWFKNKGKDQFGYQGSLLITGFFIVFMGIFILVKTL